MTKELRALAVAASKGPFKFGVGDYSPKGDFLMQEKPPSYIGLGYCDNPCIYTEAGVNIVGDADDYVFSGPDNVAYILALLNEAPALLDRPDRQEQVMREALKALKKATAALNRHETHDPLNPKKVWMGDSPQSLLEFLDSGVIAALEKELK